MRPNQNHQNQDIWSNTWTDIIYCYIRWYILFLFIYLLFYNWLNYCQLQIYNNFMCLSVCKIVYLEHLYIRIELISNIFIWTFSSWILSLIVFYGLLGLYCISFISFLFWLFYSKIFSFKFVSHFIGQFDKGTYYGMLCLDGNQLCFTYIVGYCPWRRASPYKF